MNETHPAFEQASLPKSMQKPIIAPRSRHLWNPQTAGKDFEILGHAISNVTLPAAIAEIVRRAGSDRKTRIVFVNAHVVNSAVDEPDYRRTVEQAEIRYADGSGLAIAARLAGDTLADNVNGTDMLPPLAAAAAGSGVGLYLLGGIPGAASASAEMMRALGHGPGIAGTHHGYFEWGSADEARVIDDINASGARIVLVGMGVPHQDVWIARNAARLQAPVLIGVGGLFDFYSGRKSRAPKLLRTLGLEWTWRLALEPGRMWRRYLIGNAVFLKHATLAGLRKRWHRALSAASQPVRD